MKKSTGRVEDRIIIHAVYDKFLEFGMFPIFTVNFICLYDLLSSIYFRILLDSSFLNCTPITDPSIHISRDSTIV